MSYIQQASASGAGTVTGVLGTANQIVSDGSATTPTLSLSPTLVAPGTVTATTSIASPFFASTAADIADAGAIRLGNAELIAWEASPAAADVTLTADSAENIVVGPSGVHLASGAADITTNGALGIRIGTSQGNISSTAYAFGNGVVTSSDVRISRESAGILNIDNGTTLNNKGGTLSFTTQNMLGKMATYNNVATVSGGIPAEYATVDLTAQTATITATTLYAVPAAGAGMYRISWSATITTAASVSSVLGGTNGFQILYTSPTDSVVKTTVSGNSVTSAANTTATAVGGVEIVYAKLSTNIQYQYDYTSSGTAMAYELHLKLEAL